MRGNSHIIICFMYLKKSHVQSFVSGFSKLSPCNVNTYHFIINMDMFQLIIIVHQKNWFLFFDFVVGHLIWFFFIQFGFASEGGAAAAKSAGRGAAPLWFTQRCFHIFLLVGCFCMFFFCYCRIKGLYTKILQLDSITQKGTFIFFLLNSESHK